LQAEEAEEAISRRGRGGLGAGFARNQKQNVLGCPLFCVGDSHFGGGAGLAFIA
jgi:hypothetical protein